MTIVARTFISIPGRTATATWAAIVDLVAPDAASAARKDLDAVAGTVCSCITDEVLADDPIVIYGNGPRVRIYGLYGEDAIDGDRRSEGTLSFVPTDGDWQMSIPCLPDDLAWVQRSLASASKRVVARAVGEPVDGDDDRDESRKSSSAISFAVDRDAFLRQ